MADPFEEHLFRHDLLGLHEEAQQVGYRIRTANWQVFELEYEAGLAKYNQPGMAIKQFEESERGKAEARAFLAEVQADINRLGRAKENVE